MKKISPLAKRISVNLTAALVVYFLLSGLVFTQHDYAWSIEMLDDNYDFVSKNRQMTVQDRYTSKLGVSYSLFDSVRSRTPDTAVVYLPGRNGFFPKNQVSVFTGEPYEKMWAIRFLYPRKVVSEKEYDRSAYAAKIDYVIIVYGVGTERLKYRLPQPVDFGILYADSLKLKK
jgi:hypothetical protein